MGLSTVFHNNLLPEVASDVICGVVVDPTAMKVRVNSVILGQKVPEAVVPDFATNVRQSLRKGKTPCVLPQNLSVPGQMAKCGEPSNC